MSEMVSVGWIDRVYACAGLADLKVILIEPAPVV